MPALVSLLSAIVPILLYLWAVWAMDRYDREPLSLLFVHLAWGATGAVLLSILAGTAIASLTEAGPFAVTVLIAPPVEEVMKGAFLLFSVRDRRFDNVTDGIVYGMAIGLGFGMTENFLYFLNASTTGEWLYLVIVRTLFTAVLHAMATGTLGAAFGMTKFGPRTRRAPVRLLGLALAAGMHMFWNYSVSIDSAQAAGNAALFILFSLVVILLVVQLALLSENRMLIRELEEEVSLGIIPDAHMQYLPYTRRRRLHGWVKGGVDRAEYVRLATRLAFRKAQARQLAGDARDTYDEEIAQLRARIESLLRPPGMPEDQY